MKRYAMFAYDVYYPSGGWGDFKGSYDTIEEAETAGKNSGCDNFDVVDLTTGEELM